MELVSRNGDSVSLKLDGYQFPQTSGSGERDWDANWLMVAGRVKNHQDEWSFRDPCLTTWEATELSGWLHSVAGGSRRPAPVDADGEGGDVLVFTEPCVSFVFQAVDGDEVVLRVYLWLEALPEASVGEDAAEYMEYFVELTLDREAVLAVATTRDDERRNYPVRA